MRNIKIKKSSSFGFQYILLLLLFVDQLFAYIDPGSIYAFIQLILAVAIGSFIYARNYITYFFSKIFRRKIKDSKNK